MEKIVRKFFLLAIVVLVSSLVSWGTFKMLSAGDNVSVVDAEIVTESDGLITRTASFSPQGDALARVDLTDAADKSVHAVVHIKSTENSKTQTIRRAPDIYDFFFGDGAGREQTIRTQPRVGFGSGVILSKDGYIVTNNHVIAGADEISVTLNDNRTYPAVLIGADENTDLALVKIEAEDDLPFLVVGDSDALKVGEWVLAVGNPFNLTSTVTAGIVSAKARSLGVYDGGIESFIQTDAAINKGNSGGALVNANGELVGVNAVLSSPTGSYAGYGFAIPTSIMTKVVSDLKEFGTVQRAVIGIRGGTVTAELSKEKDLGTVDGVYVSEVIQGGAAEAAGIEVDDVVVGLDGKSVKTMAEFQEMLAKHLPGDKVTIKVLRKKKEREMQVTLKNIQGNTDVVKNVDLDLLGAELKELNNDDKKLYNVNHGLKVIGVDNGLFKESGIKKGFVILKVNNTPIKSLNDLQEVVKRANASNEPVLFISGLTAAGKRAYYSVDLLR
ncbi:MAG: Do family serine endopeptidase [Bacteroidaceae bacterium]|nr:Do family serine endopeptidase [Bacteroidaceae bacterium]